MKIIKSISLILLIALYTGAGANHFMHPAGYIAIIPPYLPFPTFINYASGIAEFFLGILLIFSQSRTIAVYCLVVLLAVFIPAHIYVIQKGGCMSETICFPAWVAWLRLFPVQFLLMWWAWWHKNKTIPATNYAQS